MKPAGVAAPPLAKGLACQRCSARKVRCTGGKPACNACLRTAKFKNHPLDQVCCAYGTGLCTEHTPEKGPGGHGGRGRKLKEQQQQQQQQQQQPGPVPVINQPQAIDRRGLGVRTNTTDSFASYATGHSPQSATSSEPSYLFDLSLANSPNFTPATSIGSISPGFGKLDASSIVAALNLPQPPPHPQPPVMAKAKVPLAARRQGLGPMKIELPTTWSGPSVAGGKRPAPVEDQPRSAKQAMNQGSLLERRRGSVMPDMVIPFAKRARSNSPTQAISPAYNRAQSVSAQSQADSVHQPALSHSGQTSNGSSIASGAHAPSFADSPLVDTPGQRLPHNHNLQPQHHHHSAQPQATEPAPTPDPYPSSFASYLGGWTDTFSSFSTPLVNLMTGGGRLTAGLGVGTPFWYGDKKTAGLAELDFGFEGPGGLGAGATDSAQVGGAEVTWSRA